MDSESWNWGRVRSQPRAHLEAILPLAVVLALSCSEQPRFEEHRPQPAPLDNTPLVIAGPIAPPVLLHRTEYGGNVEATALAPGCAGRVGQVPNHRLHLVQAMSFLRMAVFGRTAPEGDGSDFTLVLLGPGGTATCAVGTAGDTTAIEGAFPAGEYELYVGTTGNSDGVYNLLLTSDQNVDERNVSSALVALTPGALLFHGTLIVTEETGDVVQVGDRCEIAESAVGDGTPRLVWSVQCSGRVLYRGRPAGPRVTEDGYMARDDFTTPIDGTPSLAWDGRLAVLADVGGSPLGAFSAELTEVPYDPHQP